MPAKFLLPLRDEDVGLDLISMDLYCCLYNIHDKTLGNYRYLEIKFSVYRVKIYNQGHRYKNRMFEAFAEFAIFR